LDPAGIRQNPELLLDDPDFDLGVDVGVQPDQDPVDAESANRLMELDLPLLDRESLRLELVRDVRGGNGAEELAFVSDARREGQRDLLKLGRELARSAAPLFLSLLEALALLLDPLPVARRRLVGKSAGEQVVAPIPSRCRPGGRAVRLPVLV